MASTSATALPRSSIILLRSSVSATATPFAASSAPSVEVAFEVLDSDGEPVPFAHLHFAWEEGGTLAFQTDEEAALVMRFERAAPTGDAAVWVRTLPEGHVFTTEREASWQPLAAGEVRIAVRVGA